MAKISELIPMSAAAVDLVADLVAIVDTSSHQTKRITISGLKSALGGTEDGAFTTVTTEAQFDAALAAGLKIQLPGEGSVVELTTPKVINTRFTEIRGPGHLRFTFPPVTASPAGDPRGGFHSFPPNTAAQCPRAITINADDVTLSNFELSNNIALTSNTAYGIYLSEVAGSPGHRLKLLDMNIHDWGRCINKDGDYTTATSAPIHEDILIDRCHIHTFYWSGIFLIFGMRRLVIRDTRSLGILTYAGGTPTHHNAVAGGGNWYDCVMENCHFGNCGRMGVEIHIQHYTYFQQRTRMSNCLVENCSGMGISIAFGTETVLEKCRIKNVHWIGIELVGTAPEKEPGSLERYASGILESCEVDGVATWSATGNGQSIGISIDAAKESVIRGATKVSNITATPDPLKAGGIIFADCERCSVRDATLINAGHRYIMTTHSEHVFNTRGYIEIIGNTFRNDLASGVHQAIYIHDQTTEVQQNVTWQKSGTTLNYCYNIVLPAVCTCDGVALPPAPAIDTVFPTLGSNIIVSSGSELNIQ